MRKPSNLMLLSLLVAAVGAALVYRTLNLQQAALDEAWDAARRSTESVSVVVAARVVEIGSKITSSDVAVLSWPAESAPAGAIDDPGRVVGRIARASLGVNQPISESLLADRHAGLLPLLIEDGMRAMSVTVDRETGVSGFITPNSHVDVLATGTIADSGGRREQRAKLILQNVKVLAIGKSIEIEDNEPVEVPTVTLLVTPEESEKLTLATQQRPVRLSLRHYLDEAAVQTSGLSMTQLLDHEDVVLPEPEVVAVRTAPRRPSIEVLFGEDRRRVNY